MEARTTTDIVGKEVRIDDTVLVGHTDSNNLFYAKVIDIMPKRMKCRIFDSPGSYRYIDDNIVQRLPEQVIKIED